MSGVYPAWICPAKKRTTTWGYGHHPTGSYHHWGKIPGQQGIGWQRSTCLHCGRPIIGPFTDADFWVELFVIEEEIF